MEVRTPLVPHLEPTEAIEPRERPLDHPTIAPQPLTRLDAPPRDAWDDTTSAQRPPTAWVIVALIGMQLHGALARPSAAAVRLAKRCAAEC
jgi:hypothetical protein